MKAYDNLFIHYGEALSALSVEMERERTAGGGAHLSDAAQERLSSLQFLRAYVLYSRCVALLKERP